MRDILPVILDYLHYFNKMDSGDAHSWRMMTEFVQGGLCDPHNGCFPFFMVFPSCCIACPVCDMCACAVLLAAG